MPKKINEIRRIQIDNSLENLGTSIPPIPRSGWISEIRKALMLSTNQLAKKLGVTQSTVTRMEQSEAKKSITLSSLEKAAEALNCELKYVLVPRESLDSQVQKQAEKIYFKENQLIKHSQALENQFDELSIRENIEIAYLIQDRGSKIWDEND